MIRYFKNVFYPTKEKQIERSAEAIISRIGLSDLSDTEKASVFVRANQKFDLRLEDKIKEVKARVVNISTSKGIFKTVLKQILT